MKRQAFGSKTKVGIIVLILSLFLLPISTSISMAEEGKAGAQTKLAALSDNGQGEEEDDDDEAAAAGMSAAQEAAGEGITKKKIVIGIAAAAVIAAIIAANDDDETTTEHPQ
jgi:TPR repeat protein